MFLVIGGAGFLGQAIVRMLLERGESVRVFDLRPHPDPAVQSFVGDILNPDHLTSACQDVICAIHTASLVDWTPGSQQRVRAVNVDGTRNIIHACQQAGVRKLIYTSSIDVVFDGTPIRDGDESLPIPARHLDEYGASKATAEQIVLAANHPAGLLTCALRAAGIYGPGDPHRFPSLIAAAQQGQYMRIGDGSARFNHVFVDNLAHAHLLAADALSADHPASGKPYFIVDGAAHNFFAFADRVMSHLGYRLKGSIPLWLAVFFASLLEMRAKFLPMSSGTRPALTMYAVKSVGVDFCFSGSRAERELGYAPIVSEEQALHRTITWLRTTYPARSAQPEKA